MSRKGVGDNLALSLVKNNPDDEREFCGIDITHAPQDGFRARARKLREALFFARSQKWYVIALITITLLIAALNALEPLILKYIFDGLSATNALHYVIGGVSLLLVLGLSRESTSSFSNWLTWRTRLRLQHHLLDLTVERIHRLPHHVHHREGVGAIMTRLDRSIQGLIQTISDISLNIIPAFLYLGISISVMLRMDWRLTLIILAFTPFPILIANLAVPRQVLREKTLLEKWSKIYSRFNEVLSGIITVRSFAMEETEKRRFLGEVSKANGTVVKGVAFDSTVGALQNLVLLLARICGIGAGGYLVSRGEITLGTLIAFLGYLGGVFGPVQQLAGTYRTLSTASVSADQILSILNARDRVCDAPNAVSPEPVRGRVSFENVHFSYGKNGRPVLKDLSFDVKPGEVIAIIGPSGSGKSTMMALLQRFHDPTLGTIRLDGKDLRSLKQLILRRNIGVVMQDALLFNESVRANISYGKPDATMEEVESAARTANAHEFITRLEKGYDTPVGERGSRFSAGERQRIAIARAILKNPPILILDEATSALDAETEFMVQQALEKLIRGRTTFVIAHRLNTIVKADRILVLKKGQIVEVGNHRTLMGERGYYASMVRRQAIPGT